MSQQPWLANLQQNNQQNAFNANSQVSQMDADGDGKLSAKELAYACSITILEAEEIIKQYDANGDGLLDQDEFEDLKNQILQQQGSQLTMEINANTEFSRFDDDGDGRLTATELAQACGMSVEDAQNVIYQYDANGDGTLDPDEFEDLKQQILQQQRDMMTNNINAMDTHQAFDANGDGKLDANELAQACNITVQEAQNIIYQYDANGDGLLDPQEFEDLKQQILQQQREMMTNVVNADDNIQSMDDNGDGKLSAIELANACNISAAEAQNIIMQFDKNGDGMLDPQEFEELKQQILEQQRQRMTNKINANDNLQGMDDNGDGKLTAEEFAKACSISLLEAQNIIKQYDVNGDGMLDPEEFEDLKQQILQQQRDMMTDKLGANDDHSGIDADGDGKLDASELANQCDISVLEAENIIAQYDRDGDGKLDPQEFENLKQQILQQQRDKAANAFNNDTSYNQFDSNNDGRIDANELAQQCNITVEEAELLIEQNDTDGDGYLDQQEFEQLKQKILADQAKKDEEKNENYTTPQGPDPDVAAYQSAVYNNQQPQMQLNNSNGRNTANSTFQPYNQSDNAPAFSGDINKVDTTEYDPSNSNAKAFGVDIFANEKNNKPQQQYQQPQKQPLAQPSYNNNNKSSPFGQPSNNNNSYNNNKPANTYNNNSSPFGKPSNSYGNNNAAKTNPSPFGSKPGPSGGTYNVQNNVSPFGKNPNANNYGNNNKPAVPSGPKPKRKYKHKWQLGIKFDPKLEQIILTIKDETTVKQWRKIITKNDTYGTEIKKEYFRLGGIITNGSAKYTYPPNGIGAVRVALSHGNANYNFAADPM